MGLIDDGPSAAQVQWAKNAWSRVCQRRVPASEVIAYSTKHGWTTLELELVYWLRMSRLAVTQWKEITHGRKK